MTDRHTVLTGDAAEVMATLPADSFDAMLCDPPYHLTTGKKGGTGPASVNLDSPYGRARVTTGFMGMKWDGGDVAHNPATWAAALRLLKPGAFGLVACGTRTQHRLACALEDAGFEVRDVVAWLYAQGFPKSMKVDAPGWDGYGTALKPAMELWTLVRKPPEGTIAHNALKHGVGGLNIDGSRIPFAGDADETESKTKNAHAAFGSKPRDNKVFGFDPRDRAAGGDYDPPGRWPANVIHDGSDEVLAGFPDAKSAYPNAPAVASRYAGTPVSDAATVSFGSTTAGLSYSDAGSAARFFYVAKASAEERDAGLAGRCPHPTMKPIALTTYLARLILPPERDTPRRILVPFAGVGSEMIGARLAGWDHATGIEREPEYTAIAEARLEHHTSGRLW